MSPRAPQRLSASSAATTAHACDPAPPDCSLFCRSLLAPPNPPSWAQQGRFSNGYKPDRDAALRLVKSLNGGAGRSADMILWGDSLTAGLARGSGAQAWASAFRGLTAVPLGVRSATVEQLAWRLFRGGEMPKRAPRVAVFFIGAVPAAIPVYRAYGSACTPGSVLGLR